MSNLPQNPYASGPPSMNANAPQPLNHNQPFNSVPLGQLPPGYNALKQDANSSSPLLPPQNNAIGQVNNYNQSANSSPAFNHPGMMPPQGGLQSSPLRPTMKPPISLISNLPNTSLPSSTVQSSNASPVPYPANYQQHQINNNALPLIPSSHSQSLVNGPSVGGPVPVMSHPQSQYAAASSGYGPSMVNRPVGTAASVPNFGPGPVTPSFGHQAPPQGLSNLSRPNTMTPPNVPFSGPSLSGPPRNSPLLGGPSVPLLPKGTPALGPSVLGPSTAGPPLARPMGVNGPSSLSNPLLPPGPGLVNGPGLASGPMGPPLVGPPVSGPPQFGGLQSNGPPGPPAAPVGATMPHQYGPPSSMPPPIIPSGPQNLPMGHSHGPVPPMGPLPMSTPPGPPSGPLNGPPKNNMQGRYPPMPQSNYQHPGQVHTQQPYPQQYHPQGLTQQMGQLSVTKQGFDQLWGHQMVDLMTCKTILPEYPEDPPEIRLGNQFADSPNCSPEIFRCTVNKIPETNALLQKSRLPLGILIHPFKDLNHLPVIQCSTIVRCRACRTYINPFVYFVDAKRWKCNLCYRVNDLPEEFQYDPVSKSYGDPSRRPEIKSATIEFIAPAEYMLRPPQPAVYLFLMDVSQMARDSGYLQVLCDTLLANLDQLPGDARTQVGFICYDAHVHYYLMADGLTRPKEMTVLDVDDIFLPSPESLLVNLGERRALIRELLSALPRRHSAPQPASNSALGAALQAAYKLMAPTGGRVTVFQTCLPNVGPGALQPREDPNARSSAEVSHLNPATDFYKRLALECSGAQVAVDLFLLSAQYADLASLSGMSKFSAGTVYHIPVFRAARGWQAQQFSRMLTRYLTRKIGFEAVMRVRCTRGITIHTFHGNFFVRSTDLLSLPNVSPDAGFGMQLSIEESLADLQQVCFQAALLYTSSKGERRIRVHTMALPTTSTLPEVLHSADQQAIIGLLSKMASDRCASASMSEAREALMNVAVDALSAFRLAQNLPAGAAAAQLHAPLSLRVLPLYLLALLKRKAFRSGLSTRLDDRVADMGAMKTLPLSQLIRAVYPDLYPIHALADHQPGPRAAPGPDDKPEYVHEPDPPRLHLSAERINSNGAYLLDDGETMIVYVCHAVSPAFLSETFGVAAFSQLPDEARVLPRIETDGNDILHAFIDKLNDDRPYASNVLLLRDNSPNRTMFTERLVDDRVESAFAYYEFLQHIKTQVK